MTWCFIYYLATLEPLAALPAYHVEDTKEKEQRDDDDKADPDGLTFQQLPESRSQLRVRCVLGTHAVRLLKVLPGDLCWHTQT